MGTFANREGLDSAAIKRLPLLSTVKWHRIWLAAGVRTPVGVTRIEGLLERVVIRPAAA